MDRPLDQRFLRRRLVSRLLYGAGALALAAGALVLLSAWMRPALQRGQIRTDRVARGPVEATITATGTVVPEAGQVLSSPTSARVLRILRTPGSVLAAGDPILVLDVSGDVLALERLEEQVALKRNEQLQERLRLESELIALKSQARVKRLDLETYRLRSEQNRRLFSRNLISEGELRQAELIEKKTEIELQQLQEAQQNAERSTEARLAGLTLELRILEKERAEAARLLDRATTKAESAGVLTWVVEEPGTMVNRGDVIARVADLSSYRVEASVSDVHAARLSAGQPVHVRASEGVLAGRISRVLPTVTNGVMTVQIELAEKSSPVLRDNLRVDVHIVTDRKPDALRLRKGPFVTGNGLQQLFVLRGDRAVRVQARLGLSGFEHYEVESGLQEGDEVVISDMNDYLHLSEIELK